MASGQLSALISRPGVLNLFQTTSTGLILAAEKSGPKILFSLQQISNKVSRFARPQQCHVSLKTQVLQT